MYQPVANRFIKHPDLALYLCQMVNTVLYLSCCKPVDTNIFSKIFYLGLYRIRHMVLLVTDLEIERNGNCDMKKAFDSIVQL